MVNLFVYGTLKRGYHNCDRLLRTSTFVSVAVTTGRYTLVNGGFPRMMKGSDGYVVGELWQVSRPVLALCDRLEGHPNWYRRRRVWIMTDDGAHMRANAYIMPRHVEIYAHGNITNIVKPDAGGLLDWQADYRIDRNNNIVATA